MKWKTIVEILDDYDASLISRRQAANRISKYTSNPALRSNNNAIAFMLMLESCGIQYRKAIVSENLYLTLIAGHGGVEGDNGTFAQLCFNSEGTFIDLSLYHGNK